MKLLLKLAIAALIANTIYRVGHEYLSYIKFRDAVRVAATSRARGNEELRFRIGEIADEYDIPQDIEAIEIRRADGRVIVHGVYTKAIEVVPAYRYPWAFMWDVDALAPTSTEVPPR
ncbi:MAG: hypothetical protein LBQ09_00605 [Acidobacteriaceae bacterium]|jgi:hypothetical protein|nr:hypothetical protein [Acidobacteriaceae bacterium]